jgi:hypothetical protein
LGEEPAFYAGEPAMKRKRKPPKPRAAHVLLKRAEDWQNVTVIAHPFKPHHDPGKPYCAECGWPRGNHQ